MQEQGLSSSDALVSSGGAPSSVVTAAGGQPACALGSQSIFDDEVKQAQEFPDTFVESTFVENTETQATLAYEPSSASSENEPKKDLSLKFDAAASAAGSVKSPVSETAVVPSTPAITLPGSSPKQDAAVLVANTTQQASGEKPASSGSKGKDLVIEIQDSLHVNMVSVCLLKVSQGAAQSSQNPSTS